MSLTSGLFPKTIYAGNQAVETTVITTSAQLNQALNALLSAIINSGNADNVDDNKRSLKQRVVSIDVEEDYKHETSVYDGENNNNNNNVTKRVSMVKLCYNTTCLIIEIMHIKTPPCSLLKFLQLPQLTFVGKGINHGLAALERDYGIVCRNAVDLGEWAAKLHHRESYRCFGLLDLAQRVGCAYSPIETIIDTLESMDVSESLVPWNSSKEQVEIATLYACLSFHVGFFLLGGRL